ncbi:MAG: glutathione synthase [Arsenophonus sp.]|nr:MAG: glutathione synthase [Arsenophonus sp.]
MIKLGIIMDPISKINIDKDTSFVILLEAQYRKYQIFYMEIQDIYYLDGEIYGNSKILINLKENLNCWYEFGKEKNILLKKLDVILFRKDPPFNTQYLHTTYLLHLAEKKGSFIINKPKSIRHYNEKLLITYFPQFIPYTLVTNNIKKIREFHKKYQDIIIKPIHKMGGESIFRLKKNDPNTSVILESVTKKEKRFCMVQNYLNEIQDGDKRILIINGNPISTCLARIPKIGETRANLAVGGKGEIRNLTKNDWKIAKTVSLFLKEKGLFFVGIDIIGNYLTEINITSPTCLKEINTKNNFSNYSITKLFLDEIEKQIKNKKNEKKY